MIVMIDDLKVDTLDLDHETKELVIRTIKAEDELASLEKQVEVKKSLIKQNKKRIKDTLERMEKESEDKKYEVEL